MVTVPQTWIVVVLILGLIHLSLDYLKKKMSKKRIISNPIDLAEVCKKSKSVNFQEEILMLGSSKRNFASWLPKNMQNIKGVVFIAHGLLEHALAYSVLAERLVDEGFAVYAIDHVGHGLSDGKRGIIPDYQVVYKDFVSFVEVVRKRHSGKLPTFLFCHSMGGLVGVMSVNKLENITAVIFSSIGLISGPGSASPFGIRFLYSLSQTHSAGFLTQLIASFDPESPTAPIILDEVTSSLEELEEMARDPRRTDPFISNKSAAECLKFIKAAKAEIPHITLPFLCIHGSKDVLTYKEGSEFLYSKSSTPIDKKQFKIIEGAKHECIHEREPIKSNTIDLIVNYFKQYL